MTEPDLWMKGLGRVLSWVGQDLPTEARGKGSSEGEADIDVLAQRLLTQGRLSADDEATLELLRATIQSARVERSLADQSAGALRLDLKSLQEELSASRSEVLRLGRALDDAGNKKREQDNLLEQRDLELEDAASERSKLEEQVEKHAARVEALEMRLERALRTRRARGRVSGREGARQHPAQRGEQPDRPRAVGVGVRPRRVA